MLLESLIYEIERWIRKYTNVLCHALKSVLSSILDNSETNRLIAEVSSSHSIHVVKADLFRQQTEPDSEVEVQNVVLDCAHSC